MERQTRKWLERQEKDIENQKANLKYICINVAEFKYSGETDWALAINRAIQYFIDNKLKYGSLELPQGVLKVYSKIIDIPFPITIKGKGAFLESVTSGTFIDDLRPDEDATPLFTFKNTTDTHIQGHLLRDFTINGNYKVRDCLYVYKCGWDFRVENVLVKRYKGAAFRGEYLDDSTFIDFFTVACGSDGNVADPTYAMEFDNNCNALHFFGLHQEHSRFFMRLNDTFFIDFTGSKWEQSTYAMGTNLTHPPIYLGNCREVTFGTGCGFIPIGVKTYLKANPNMDYTLLPYFIGGSATDAGNLDREVVKFIGCQSTTGLGSGDVLSFPVDYHLLMNLEKRVILIGNVFNNLTGILEPIRVGADGKPGIIMGNEITVKDHPTTIDDDIENTESLYGYSKGVRSENCIVDGNTIWHMSSGATTRTSYAFNGVLNRYGMNEALSFVYKYNDMVYNEITENANAYVLPDAYKSLYRFEDELTSQTIKDSSFFKNHGQLGNGTGTDANDPVWDVVTGGLKFVKTSNQYAKLPLSISVSSNFSIYMLANIPSTAPSSESVYLSLGNSASSIPNIKVYRSANGDLSASWCNDANTTGTVSTITSTNVKTGYRLLKLTKSGTTLTIKQIVSDRLNSSGNTNGTNGSVPTGTTTINQIGLGCLLKDTASNFSDITICFIMSYQKSCTGTEDVKVLNYSKRLMAERGLS